MTSSISHRVLVIAGSHSGVGKTTVTLGLIGALRRHGLVVQPFKIGPDFIDPGHLAVACGRPARNLDTWMLADETVRSSFWRAAAGSDICIVEGVMGLFDGRSAQDMRGSTAHVAELLAAPVLLVVDASGTAASIAAIVKGFAELDRAVPVAAVLCNRVAGPRHYEQLESAIRRHTSVHCAGWLPRQVEWQIPQRHLGLVTQDDLQILARGPELDHLGLAFAGTVNVDLLLELSQVKALTAPQTHASIANQSNKRARVGVARDAAFCFCYQDNLELLESAGAELRFFSPLGDDQLPRDLAAIYLCGGYPELHAARLAANQSMIAELRNFHRSGRLMYAECGGLMYCGRELVDADGHAFPMLDLLPARTVMQKRRAALGYVTWRASEQTLLGGPGTEVRGHEFHYSRLEPLGAMHPSAMLVRDGEEPRPDGFVQGGLLAGYAHLHFGSNPSALETLIGRTGSESDR
jgi:cobyrinic acid a,c-diamide synthase